MTAEADPVDRYAQDALWLFRLLGAGVSGPWHAKDPVGFVSIITGHRDLATPTLAMLHMGQGPTVSVQASAVP